MQEKSDSNEKSKKEKAKKISQKMKILKNKPSQRGILKSDAEAAVVEVAEVVEVLVEISINTKKPKKTRMMISKWSLAQKETLQNSNNPNSTVKNPLSKKDQERTVVVSSQETLANPPRWRRKAAKIGLET